MKTILITTFLTLLSLSSFASDCETSVRQSNLNSGSQVDQTYKKLINKVHDLVSEDREEEAMDLHMSARKITSLINELAEEVCSHKDL